MNDFLNIELEDKYWTMLRPKNILDEEPEGPIDDYDYEALDHIWMQNTKDFPSPRYFHFGLSKLEEASWVLKFMQLGLDEI